MNNNYKNNDELAHFGVLGMRWGHRKAQTSSSGSGGSGKKSQGVFSKNRSERIKVANELAAVRAKRSRKAKIADWLLSGPESGKLFSERYGKSETAKKGAKLSDKLKDMRKQRDTGEKVLDALLTPGLKTKTFTERPARERRRIVALTTVALAAGIGLMKMSKL